MSETLTFEQEIATRPGASIWVSASAGTGKTHVLTARVLRLMLTGTDPAKILCVTFTKAAAAEMANRVYRVLGEWTALDDPGLAGAINARTGEKPDEEMLARARQLFARVLDVPGGLKIQTIHSFCQSLLGRFPLEAGLPPHFQVMDDRTAAEFVDEATSAILWDARNALSPSVREALAHLAARINEQQFTELLAALARERRQLRRMFAKHGGEEGLIAATRQALGLKENEDEASLIAEVCAPGNFDAAGLKTLVEALAGGSDAEQQKANAIGDFLAAKDGNAAFIDEHRQAFLTTRDEPRKALANKKTVEDHPEILDVIEAETGRLLAFTASIKTLRSAENTAALLRLAWAFLDHYAAAKARHALLDYDDLILKTETLLGLEGIAPWILYKLDGGIDHILVDEAQDTNPEQWRLIEALSNEFFSGAGAQEQLRTLFAVGDAKQSIFAFQRADPAEFTHARIRTTEKTAAVGLAFENVALTLSFRSTAAVLGFVDEVFADPDVSRDLTLDGEAIAHQESRRGESGLVEIWPPEVAEPEALPEDWALPSEQLGVASADARLARRIALRIRKMTEGSEKLKASGRAIRAGDILVLVRRRGPFVDQLLRALKALDVPVAGADRMILTDQLAVMDLMALARFALLPADDLNLACVLKGPLAGLDEDELFTLAYDRGNDSLWQRLKTGKANAPRLAKAHGFLADILSRADYATPYEFFARILNVGEEGAGGRQALNARLGAEVNDPIDEFLSLALAFERAHAPSLQGFLAWLEAGEAQIKRDMEQERDEVRVMTIHGAKGLEAPVVFLPDTCQVPTRGETFLWLDGEDFMIWPGAAANESGRVAEARQMARDKANAEHRRLLYVALTRARDRLYIAGWDGQKKRPEECWYNILDRAFTRLAEGSSSAIEEIEEDGRSLRRLETAAETVVPDKGAARRKSDGIAGLPDWTRQAPVAEPLPLKPLTPSGPDEDAPPVNSPMAAEKTLALKRGRLVHSLLEFLPELAPESRARAAEKFLEARAAGLDPEERAEIWQSVRRVLEDEKFAPLFAPGSLAEVSIAGRVGDRALAGQIDRLVVSGEDVLIVDYKSNRPPPKTAEGVSKTYLRQMAAYTDAIEQIYPGKKVSAALLWTEEARLMPLDRALLSPWLTDRA
ncbi:MAG: double-strand break repair helicase AddA [Proteobacteria bacterium]|nr:double-strand break repair helicase AddA [Pseudomonadota bacterium]